MIKIPLTKNSLVIDHRARETDGNVICEANCEAGFDCLQVPGAGCKPEPKASSLFLTGPHLHQLHIWPISTLVGCLSFSASLNTPVHFSIEFLKFK